jgi:hypothetical protein
MLMAAMLAMVLAVAAPAMAQQGDFTATQNVQQQVAGGGNIAADISYSECVAIVSQGGNAQAAAVVVQSATASVTQTQNLDDEDFAAISQYCIDIVDSFNVTKLFVGRFGIL